MPIGYLIGVVVVALPTLFALAPQRALPNVSFRLGLLLNEVPIIGFYWLVIGTAPAILQGDINSPGGWAILGLAAVTTAGLAVIAWRGLQARPALEQAMAEALGAGWRTAIDPELAARLRRRLPFARMLVLPLSRRRDVERVANLPYGDAGRRNLLDLYRQRAHPSGGPVLIHLHGGGYTQGRKNTQSLPLLYRLASQGWVCVSANYRLRPAAQHPEHLIDLKKVIAWVRVHGPEYGADPALLFVSGSSAGAHLAALAALTPNDPSFQPGFEDADTSVTAAIGLNGWYGGYYGHADASSPLAHVRPDAPPCFIAHGDHDTVAPVEVARHFAATLASVSANPVVYAELPGAQHAFDLFGSLRFELVVDAVEAFTAWVRSSAPRADHDLRPRRTQRGPIAAGGRWGDRGDSNPRPSGPHPPRGIPGRPSASH
jgi:acetyl esterase/lipase